MGEWLEVSARTTDEAVTEALIKLGTTSDRVEYEVLEKESRGFFGLGSRAARIRARVKEETIAAAGQGKMEKKSVSEPAQRIPERRKATEQDEVRAEEKKEYRKKEEKSYHREERPYYYENRSRENQEYHNPYSSSSFRVQNGEEETAAEEREVISNEMKEPVKIENVEELKQDAEKFLKDIFTTMGMNAQMEVSFHEMETTIEIDLKGDDMGILIGKRGQTLDSLQYLVSLVVNRKSNSYVKVKLDTENYRERRRETLENLARNIAFKVKRTKRPVTLEPMNPYERRIIHSALQYDKFVETHSEGEEPYRKVVVALKRNSRDYGNRRNGRSSYRRDYKRDSNNYRKTRQIEKEAEKKDFEE